MYSEWNAPSDRDYYGSGDGDYDVVNEDGDQLHRNNEEPPICTVCEEALSEVVFRGAFMCADCVEKAICPDCNDPDCSAQEILRRESKGAL